MPGNLSPWRDVMLPHLDVSSGQYEEAEFAADLAAVYTGRQDIGAEYSDPAEFFRRTYLTAGMSGLLRSTLGRLSGQGGDPVIQLKTAFGGGKTHSMLALYHMLTGRDQLKDVESVQQVVAEADLDSIPPARMAVLVGTYLDPNKGRPLGVGIELRTLWGEMAWQLAGMKGYQMVADADQAGVAPGGQTFDGLFEMVGPCVILIDELVAYVRNVGSAGGRRNISGGTLESNMTFVQNLTESVKRNPSVALVASIPESDIEVGGPRGVAILQRIENTFGRVEAVWTPVEPHESFEVVRRRLFGEIDNSAARDATCAAFARTYRRNASDFPPESREGTYEHRMRSSYPIHPEFFDRLYNDWSSTERFQRTRGVLRLMAAVIHELWRSGDTSPMIMPGSLPLYAPRVRTELLRYLDAQWNPVVDEADGDESEAARVDSENDRFGRVQAARRLTRTIFLGSVPFKATRGVEDLRIRLGVVQPEESISIYNDALSRLQQRLQYVYNSGEGRYWFDVQPNLTRAVADRAGRVTDDDAYHHLEKRLKDLRLRPSDFSGIHVCPQGTDEVPDQPAARLVVLSPRHGHVGKEQESDALTECDKYYQSRGNSPRTYRNMIVFAAADEEAVSRLVEETKRHMAWTSVQKEFRNGQLSLDKGQQIQVNESVERSDNSVQAALDAAYQWVLCPEQEDNEEGPGAVTFTELSLRGVDLGSVGNLVQRVEYRIENEEMLILNWSPIHLKRELDQYLWKDGRPHITVKELWNYYATYVYLSRLKDRDVLMNAIKAGVMTRDFFGYATGVQGEGEDTRYLGLNFGGPAPGIFFDDTSVVVRPEIAQKALERLAKEREQPDGDPAGVKENGVTYEPGAGPSGEQGTVVETKPSKTKRFYATVKLDPNRLGTQAGTISQEVLTHLASLLSSQVEVTLEIEARAGEGYSDDVMRTVIENARTLNFETYSFEEE